MELLEEVDDDVMIAAFVQAEFDSPRFGPGYEARLRELGGARGDVIDHPDMSDRAANDMRRALLRHVRGYETGQYLFEDWPTDVQWWRARVGLAELTTLMYANHPTWLCLTGGSRLIGDGAANVDTVFVAENANANIKAVATSVKLGERFPELIVVAETEQGPFVVIEGHSRATAYVLAKAPETVDVIVGVSPCVKSSPFW